MCSSPEFSVSEHLWYDYNDFFSFKGFLIYHNLKNEFDSYTVVNIIGK